MFCEKSLHKVYGSCIYREEFSVYWHFYQHYFYIFLAVFVFVFILIFIILRAKKKLCFSRAPPTPAPNGIYKAVSIESDSTGRVGVKQMANQYELTIIQGQ